MLVNEANMPEHVDTFSVDKLYERIGTSPYQFYSMCIELQAEGE